MDNHLKNQGNQFGFYDPVTKKFYVIPASSEEEFKKLLFSFAKPKTEQVPKEKVSHEEKFDDFDFMVDEISKKPENPLGMALYEYDI